MNSDVTNFGPKRSSEPQEHVRVAIIGTGFGGLGTAIRLLQEGERSFLVFERAEAVGGVWRDNSYPGCACDVPSHLYSFSFARNPRWSRSYSPQGEIWQYLKDCAERFGVTPHLRFRHEIHEARWNEEEKRWYLETSKGLFTADVLVGAVGALSEPSVPELPGLDTFLGKTFHSARWDHAHDLRGRKVAVIGTGASAIQFVPKIQPDVAELHLFQRTPPWVLPRRDRTLSDLWKNVLVRSSLAQLAVRSEIYVTRELTALFFMKPRFMKIVEGLARLHLKRAVKDAALREKLTPNYTVGCKRVLLSNDYLPAVAQPNVSLVTEGIREIRPGAIVTNDGVVRDVDTIIFGTGFRIQEFPFAKHVRGRGGRLLADTWKETMTAHLGTTVHGYPNLFLLQGPNTGLGHTSVITMIEAQVEHVVNALGHMKRHAAASVEPRLEAQEAFVRDVDERMRKTVWSTGGCKSWYLDKMGRNSTLWPGFTFDFMRRVRPFDPDEYIVTARATQVAPSPPKARPRRLLRDALDAARGRSTTHEEVQGA